MITYEERNEVRRCHDNYCYGGFVSENETKQFNESEMFFFFNLITTSNMESPKLQKVEDIQSTLI